MPHGLLALCLCSHMQTVTNCTTACSCTCSANKSAHLIELWESVCLDGRCGQSIVQRLHQMAPPVLIWNMQHGVSVHLQDKCRLEPSSKLLAACQAICTTPCRSKRVTILHRPELAFWLVLLGREVIQRVDSVHMWASGLPVRRGQQPQLVPSHHPELPLHEPQHLVHC